jgi:Ca2+-transporting ATPase
MTTVYATKNGFVSFTKGAAEVMLDLCNKIQTSDGVRDITEKDKEKIKKQLIKLSSQALRVLGMASKELDKKPAKDENCETDMTFKGIIGMIDPPRPEVFDAIKTCHEADVRVAMITGDHPITALAIAHELGIVQQDDSKIITGVEIDAMTEDQLKIAVKDCSVYARVSPDNKLRIVQAFKKNDMITGMTGDGTNDAPALKAADIGIAMGISGTDVAKGAASILLLDDNFTTIKSAITDGRKITRNIKNVISFILATNLATAAFIFLFTYCYGFNPITITQRLLLDLVTDTLPCIFIGLNPNIFGIMKGRNKDNDKLLDKHLLIDVLINTISMFAVMCIMFFVSAYGFGIDRHTDNSHELDILCFMSLSISRIFLSINFVSRTASIFSKDGRVYKKL